MKAKIKEIVIKAVTRTIDIDEAVNQIEKLTKDYADSETAGLKYKLSELNAKVIIHEIRT